MFLILLKRSDEFPRLKELEALHSVRDLVMGNERIRPCAIRMPDAMDQTLQFVTYYMFNRLDFHILIDEVPTKGTVGASGTC